MENSVKKIRKKFEKLSNKKELQNLKEQIEKSKGLEEENNIFNILDVSGREIYHSKFLSWIMDPNTSGIESENFLKMLFEKIEKINDLENMELSEQNRKFLNNLQSLKFDKINLTIEKEYPVPEEDRERRFDILIELIENESERGFCSIENKISSPFNEKKLRDYRNIAREKSDIGYLCVALAPEYKKFASCPDKYFKITYSDILSILNEFSESAKGKDKVFLDDYRSILKGELVKMNKQEMGKTIRKVIDNYGGELSEISNRLNHIKKKIEDYKERFLKEKLSKIADELSSSETKFKIKGPYKQDYFRIWDEEWPSSAVHFEIHPDYGKDEDLFQSKIGFSIRLDIEKGSWVDSKEKKRIRREFFSKLENDKFSNLSDRGIEKTENDQYSALEKMTKGKIPLKKVKENLSETFNVLLKVKPVIDDILKK